MSRPARRSWRAIGLGLVAGAVLSASAAAQRPDTVRTQPDTVAIPIPARPDSFFVDSLGDTIRVVRDSIQPPLALAPLPVLAGSLEPYVWDREALFASGAVSLLDLLEHVPGVTAYRVSWLLSPEQPAYLGAFGRIRIFYDGVELDPLDARTGTEEQPFGGPIDLASIELWPLEQVAVEQGAGELRVHLRSWRVRRTTPDTRVDIGTGEPNINLFRGFFGRRFTNGAALQFGFQQFSADEGTVGGDGDQLGLLARVGWASTRWSVDGYATRSRRVRADRERSLDDLPPLAAVEDARLLAYLRLGYRDPLAAGWWAQLIAANDGYSESSEDRAASAGIPADSADTTRSRAHYVATAGWNAGALRVEGTGRLRVGEGERWFSPAVRASLQRGWWAAEAYAERRADDSTTRADLSVRVAPLPYLWASVVASRASPDGDDTREAITALRGEAGLRVRNAWLFGGLLTRDGGATGAPTIFDADLVSRDLGRVTALFGGLRGPLYQDVSADVLFTRWSTDQAGLYYQPQNQLRGRLTLDTRWLRRFPTGEFGLKAGAGLEYRSATRFREGAGLQAVVPASTTLSALLEIRIQEAVLFFQSRNLFNTQYELVPGYRMPQQFLMYGVRWQFWN